MIRLDLNGSWDLYFCPESDETDLKALKERGFKPITSIVPSNIEIDLVRAGIEEDPFYGNNIYRFRKYEFYQWWYEKEFVITDQSDKLILVLKGIDTYSYIYINDVLILTTDNMMIEYEADITGLLKKGKNSIIINIKSAINMVRDMDFPAGIKGAAFEHIDEMVYIRKPAHSFGWDIAPRLLSSGIWRDIYITSRKNTRIKEVYYGVTGISDSHADLVVKFRFETKDPFMENFSVRIKGTCKDSMFIREAKTRFVSDETYIKIENPKLWWPKGYGDANLYDMTFELIHNGVMVDSRTEKIGIRKVDIQTSYNENKEFLIKINNTPIMCKGTNWVALDALHSRDKKRLKTAFDLLMEAGCNIVRCWGGNVYEDKEFFDLCDESGVMVWQDFSFACAIYPQSDDFLKTAENEAVSVIKNLRNHPSIILWAGDNEVDAMYYHFGYHHSHSKYNRISREILPKACQNHDPYRFYLPSSPYMPEDSKNDLDVPEQHNWGPRDYFKSDFYKNTSAHFISEIGYHGCPCISSIKRFITPENLWPYGNDQWDTHNTENIKNEKDRGYNRNQLMADQIKSLFGYIPEDMNDFVLCSQISQAEAKKFFIEMVRLKKWRRTGVIWWNLLDCWPQVSDAVVDYWFNKKLAFYYIKHSQQDIAIMMDEMKDWHHDVILGNDTNESKTIKYKVYDGETDEVLLEGEVYSIRNENIRIGRIKAFTGIHRLFILKWEYDNREYVNHYAAGFPPFNLDRYKGWLSELEDVYKDFSIENCICK